MQWAAVVLVIFLAIASYSAWGRLSASRVYAWHQPEAAARRDEGWVLVERAPTLRNLRGLWTLSYPPITRLIFIHSQRIESPAHPGLVLVRKLYSGMNSDGRETRNTSGFIFDRNSDRYAEISEEKANQEDPFDTVTWEEGPPPSSFFRRVREAALSPKPIGAFAISLPGETSK